MLSKKKLFSALDEFFSTDKYTKNGLKAVSNETYGRTSCIYVRCKDRAERADLESFLIQKGFVIDSNYNPANSVIEVTVSYFKGYHWDE